MTFSKLVQLSPARSLLIETYNQLRGQQIIRRMSTHYKSGALKPKPSQMPLGVVGVFTIVIPGLFVGAAISKSVANFLEENELFVPSDDDDDDDD